LSLRRPGRAGLIGPLVAQQREQDLVVPATAAPLRAADPALDLEADPRRGGQQVDVSGRPHVFSK
jgi:hypothetical protein